MSDGRDVCAREGCDNQLPPNKAWGPRRKWCSDWCRKAQYSGTCVDCGEPTSGSEGRRAEPRCQPCTSRALVAAGGRADMVRAEARRKTIARMVREGRNDREIAAEMDMTRLAVSDAITAMRKAGWDLPYRPGYGPNGRRGPTR